MGGGRDTSEYRTIFACAIDLRLAIHRLAIHRHNLTQLEDKLSSRNIISKSELSSSISKGESAAYESSWKEPPELARAASLVWLIQNKVEQDAKTFHTFIGFLEEDKKRYSIILPKLQQTYAQFQQGHETKNVPSRLPGFIVRHMGEDVLKSLVCDDDDCRGRRIRCGLGWIITRCAWYFERWSHPMELHYFGRCLGLNVDEIMEIMHAVPDVETQVRLMIYQWSSKDKLRGEGTVQSFMEVLFDGGERDLLMYIVQEFGRPAMMVSRESYDPAVATGHDILKETEEGKSQGHETKNVPSRLPGFIVRHMGEDVLKSLVCDDDDCRGRRIRGWIITECARYFELQGPHPVELRYFGRCLGLNVGEIMEIMYAVLDVETKVKLMIYQWSSKDKLRGEGTVRSFMEALFNGREMDLLMHIVHEFKWQRMFMEVSQESYAPAAAAGPDVVGSATTESKVIEILKKLRLPDGEGERQTRETRIIGVLKEVDGSHFHVFGIPENSTNLSGLKRLVMPTYDPASGYGYRQYVEGENVHPNEQILLLDQDDRLFQGYEARQLMKDDQEIMKDEHEIKLADAKWKCVFVQFKSKSFVTPGLLFLYYNPHSACSPDTLSEEESSKLIECYCYLLSTPNIVSLSYEEDDDGKDVLSVGVIKSNSTTDLPKIIIYETPQKWMKIPMQIYQEGVIKALSGPCEGGCKIYTEGINNCGGTLGMIKKAEDGQIYLYSCAHVLTVHDDGNKQKKVYIEGDADPIAVVEDHIPVRVYDRNDIVDPERFTQDLAWAKFNTTRRWSSAVKDIGAIKGIRSPMRNEMVKYYGAVSLGVQDAIKIKGTNAATKVKVEGCGWVFYKQIIKLDTRHTFIEEGDSGSAMVAHSDTKVVGILMSAGEEKYSPKASVQVGDSGSAVVAHSDTKVNGILMSADEEENSPKGSLHAYACKL